MQNLPTSYRTGGQERVADKNAVAPSCGVDAEKELIGGRGRKAVERNGARMGGLMGRMIYQSFEMLGLTLISTLVAMDFSSTFEPVEPVASPSAGDLPSFSILGPLDHWRECKTFGIYRV